MLFYLLFEWPQIKLVSLYKRLIRYWYYGIINHNLINPFVYPHHDISTALEGDITMFCGAWGSREEDCKGWGLQQIKCERKIENKSIFVNEIILQVWNIKCIFSSYFNFPADLENPIFVTWRKGENGVMCSNWLATCRL